MGLRRAAGPGRGRQLRAEAAAVSAGTAAGLRLLMAASGSSPGTGGRVETGGDTGRTGCPQELGGGLRPSWRPLRLPAARRERLVPVQGREREKFAGFGSEPPVFPERPGPRNKQ